MTLSSRSASVHTSWLSGTGRKSLTSTMRVGRSTVMAPPNSSRRPVGSGGSDIVARALSSETRNHPKVLKNGAK